MSEEIDQIHEEVLEKKRDTADKTTQVFTHECLMQRMRSLHNLNYSAKRTSGCKTLKQESDSNINAPKVTYKSVLYRNVLTRSHAEMMDLTEKRLFDFIDNLVTDYQLLAVPSFDKYKPKECRVPKKDLTGKIKVYTKKCVRYAIVDETVLSKFVEMKDVATQTKPIPNYATPLNKTLFDKLYLDEDVKTEASKIESF